MTAKQYLDIYLWTRYAEQWYWYECVALVKHRTKAILWLSLSSFWWSAINWWITGSPFNKKRKRIINSPTNFPKENDVIFFRKTPTNQRWHVACVIKADINTITVCEQNWGKWTWTWLWTDAIRVKTYKYTDVLWRFTLC